MKVYLARHGDYSIDMTQHLDVLTEQGEKNISLLTHFLKPLNIRVDAIFYSGKNRTKQTAELLTHAFFCEQAIQSRTGLNPNDDATSFANELKTWSDDVLLVGHMPFMPRLVSTLITGKEDANIVEFKTGTVVCLEKRNYDHWNIDWVISPDLFNAEI